jgi:hydroxymethylglutaryl-CoA reductase
MSPDPGRGSSRFPGFYKLDVSGRLEALDRYVRLTAEEKYVLRREGLTVERADQMVENVIGQFALPLGVALNLRVNDRDYVVPMAVEESSVVAAASHVGKLVREHGEICAESSDPIMEGQIQVLDVSDPPEACRRVEEQAGRILALANEQDRVLVRHGGGGREVSARVLDTEAGPMVVVTLAVDVRDAMGANAVNTMAEAVAPVVEEITGGRVSLRILTNLADRRLARARLSVTPEVFSEKAWDGRSVARGIVEAWAFAAADPYRAATHNKGVMNGIDAVVVATGNDWRAIEAGCHAYAARSGRYAPLTRWRMDEAGRLCGEIETPMAVGIIGGATKVHPTARIVLKILGVASARELAEVIVSVGLVQNLAALRSLVTEGIQKGHMVLHARNVAVSAGAVGDMAVRVARQMIRESRINFDRATELLKHFRHEVQERAHDLREGLHPPRGGRGEERRD